MATESVHLDIRGDTVAGKKKKKKKWDAPALPKTQYLCGTLLWDESVLFNIFFFGGVGGGYNGMERPLILLGLL